MGWVWVWDGYGCKGVRNPTHRAAFLSGFCRFRGIYTLGCFDFGISVLCLLTSVLCKPAPNTRSFESGRVNKPLAHYTPFGQIVQCRMVGSSEAHSSLGFSGAQRGSADYIYARSKGLLSTGL
jgi:hypothetical protein